MRRPAMIDFSKLDKVIHEKGRLSIMTLLASRNEPWPFQDLKGELQMSDGNLITHLRSLVKAGLFPVSPRFWQRLSMMWTPG